MSEIYALITVLPTVFGLGFMFGSAMLNDEYWHMKLASYLLFPFTILSSLHFGLLYLIDKDPTFTAWQELIGLTTNWIGWLTFIVFSYFTIWFIKTGFEYVAKKKQERLNY